MSRAFFYPPPSVALLALLRRVRDRVAGAWTQGAWARDAHGNGVGALAASACCWCLEGAVRSLSEPGSDLGRHATAALVAVLPAGSPFGCVDIFNDHHTQAECEALVDAATKRIMAEMARQRASKEAVL